MGLTIRLTHAASRLPTTARAIRRPSAIVLHVTRTTLLRPPLFIIVPPQKPRADPNQGSPRTASSADNSCLSTFNFQLSTLLGLEYRPMTTSPIKFGTSG